MGGVVSERERHFTSFILHYYIILSKLNGLNIKYKTNSRKVFYYRYIQTQPLTYNKELLPRVDQPHVTLQNQISNISWLRSWAILVPSL